jgi:hypothetical protein
MLGEPRPPYTHEQVKILYPFLTEVECRIVADIERRWRFWEVWPHMNYPEVHLWLTRRQFTAMQPLTAERVGDIPGEILNWITINGVPVPREGEWS